MSTKFTSCIMILSWFLEQEYHSIQNYMLKFNQKEALKTSVYMLVDVTAILDNGKFKDNGKNKPLSGLMMQSAKFC